MARRLLTTKRTFKCGISVALSGIFRVSRQARKGVERFAWLLTYNLMDFQSLKISFNNLCIIYTLIPSGAGELHSATQMI